MSKWQPIEQLDIEDREMFVAIARLYRGDAGWKNGDYMTDPYCVWKECDKFIRWPHAFSPTHFMYLPKVENQ